MFFRFGAALLLTVLISVLGIRIEHETLRLRRAVSRQYYHTDLLLELHAQLRLKTQQLTAPGRFGSPFAGEPQRAGHETVGPRTAPPSIRRPAESTDDATDAYYLPLLRFRQPFRPEGID